jgi:hypothetical protein
VSQLLQQVLADIRKWFHEVKEYIKEKKLEEAMRDPSRIFNGDETGFQICPSAGRVLATKGAKNVYSIEQGPSKENIIVIFTFSADGKTCCPVIVYPYKRIPEKISETVPAEWGITRSDNGWMMAEVFLNTMPTFPILILLERVLRLQLFCLLMATSHTLRTNSASCAVN